jgi:hypothetical protein
MRQEGVHPAGGWSLAPENLRTAIENIYLVGLQPVSKGSWQPCFSISVPDESLDPLSHNHAFRY